MIDEILKFNREFVANKGYEKFVTNKYPDKKIAVISCMDTRLTELLPAALGVKNGDVKMIKNAGGIMKMISEKREMIFDILIIILGNFLIALGVNLFILPCDVLSGGVSGVAVALQPIFHLPPTLVINVLTIGLFLVGVVALGKGFLLKTISSRRLYCETH